MPSRIFRLSKRMSRRWLFTCALLFFCIFVTFFLISLPQNIRTPLPQIPASANVQSTIKRPALWHEFLKVLELTRPDFTSLKVDELVREGGYPRIQDIDRNTKRIDLVRLSEKSFSITKAAHRLIVGVIPQFVDLVTYGRNTRGIVTVAGGQFTPVALVSIRMLRRQKQCHLPIEVFLPDEQDYNAYICEVVLKELNAKCVVFPNFGYKLKQYQYKIWALLFSRYEDILFLDADAFPLLDTTTYFDTLPYTDTGLVMWPDFWSSTVSPLYYNITEQTPPSLLEHATSEAGQFLFSKRKHYKTLLLATYYNLYGPDAYYTAISQRAPGEGDKDTFVTAARIFNNSYYQVRERSDSIGYIDHKGFWQGATIIQYDLLDDYERQTAPGGDVGQRETEGRRPAFLHYSGFKLNPSTFLDRLETGKRMLGPLGQTLDKFGFDIEKDIWEDVIHVGCSYGSFFSEWKTPAKICGQLEEFWGSILEVEIGR
ncbi:hypothetical protein B7494_g7063 [Chlorociboria aeruginascens]|nr:hypothetical protein B7494_g7063 [Chlorociboria aeruginascens]